MTDDRASRPQQYLTPEESTDVDKALLDSEERFLTRLTISSHRLLQTIARDLDVAMTDLTHQQIVAWFERESKARREQGPDASTLKW
ncbi:hypothetical protein [Rubidibacter lacunae]|nr:hypothetical protein [Rubidibacter lacunae]